MQPEDVFSQYSEAEKTAYLSVIASLATADRQASQQESEFLSQMAQVMGLSPQATQQVAQAAQDSNNETIKANLDQLRGSNLRYSLVTDLVSFARADGAYANDEEAMVNKISQYLGVNQQQVQTIENVVHQTQQAQAQQPEQAPQGLMDSLGDKLRSVGIPPQAALGGLIAVAAPMVLSRVMGGNRGGMGGLGGMMGGGGGLGSVLGGGSGMGGGLGGLLGGVLGSGVLGSMMGGGGGYGASPAGYGVPGGGLGGLMNVLGGLGGNSQMGPRSTGGGGLGGLMSGGLGGVLGGLLGGR
ncbi:TerB family tellurite resistance protein [Hymenobacter sp. 15J16-1T3B]|uniref:tellurite resistance TerB family protein n=1 Tax=Hymenobacter sp. 15J16-1T3B TaxID=2886941 RepID=UPI0021D45F8E|nr:TerB family tellurite resistance protein [Hymenobacter sp. 15J16-1T3B]